MTSRDKANIGYFFPIPLLLVEKLFYFVVEAKYFNLSELHACISFLVLDLSIIAKLFHDPILIGVYQGCLIA